MRLNPDIEFCLTSQTILSLRVPMFSSPKCFLSIKSIILKQILKLFFFCSYVVKCLENLLFIFNLFLFLFFLGDMVYNTGNSISSYMKLSGTAFSTSVSLFPLPNEPIFNVISYSRLEFMTIQTYK